MFFFAAKTLGVLAQLPNLLIEGVLVGALLLWTRWRRAGRIVVTLFGVTLAVFTFTPAVSILARPLEDRFPQPRLDEAPTGIIVLGGSADEAISRQRGQPALNDAAERLTEAVALSRRFPNARLVFSGGSGRLSPGDTTESDVTRQVWLSLGVPAERMEFEAGSRDTWENAVNTKALVQPKPGERWLLVTSAMHMPRSIGIFRKIDFPVIAFPVDYQTGGVSADFYGVRRSDSLRTLDSASHEWIGLVAYWLRGKTSEFLPGP
jgi:uncharacterized SAM-binding protein YcdF (DUF218 family)